MLKAILQIDYGWKSVNTLSIVYTQKDSDTLETMAEKTAKNSFHVVLCI